MKILYFFVAVVVLLFQICPSKLEKNFGLVHTHTHTRKIFSLVEGRKGHGLFLFLVYLACFILKACSAQGPPPDLGDTIACRAKGQSYCIYGSCPPTFSVSGNCHGGLTCCTKILA
ncbi:gallinacin-10-like [Lacerta agilis]|uniref:gallinacin-10-like n=1 Tax=Lacerta agilis TaxID=80427 RepID=UPI00141A1D5E|nr:gallinacin-10-like [Lacerta agilis]